jgi:ATP-dependent Clp protease adapter protein ClpS
MLSLQRAPSVSRTKPKPQTQTNRFPYYKVFLHDHRGHLTDKTERRYVVGCILQTFDDMEKKEAIKKVYMAYKMGVSLLRIYPQDRAEFACDKLRRNAIHSTIEPMDF